MNTRVLGSALVMTSALAFPSGEAAAAENSHCIAVYDEVDPGGVSPHLQRVIDYYAAREVEVHVEIDKIAPNGVKETGDIGKYQAKLAAQCGYADAGYLSVFVSLDPRLFNTHKENKADEDIAKSDIDDANPSFIAHLKDSSTSYQEDVAKLLEDIDPYSVHPQPTKPPVETGGSGDSGDAELPDIPFGPIGIGLGSLIGLGALGTRGKRHLDISSMYHHADNELADELGLISTSVHDADEVVQLLPDDDEIELRSAINELVDASGDDPEDFGNQRRLAKLAYRSQVTRFMPKLEDVREIVETVNGITGRVKGMRERADQLLALYKSREESFDSLSSLFNTTLKATHDSYTQLQSFGWNLSALNQKIKKYDDLKLQIKSLRDANYVGTPAKLIEENTPELLSLREAVRAIAPRREQADAEINSQLSVITQLSQTVAETQAKFTLLQSKYDPSCYEDLQLAVTNLSDDLSALNASNADAQLVAGKLDYTKLEEAEGHIARFKKAQTNIHIANSQLRHREKELVRIETELPNVIAAIDQRMQDVHDYAFDKFEIDIEDATREAIDEIERDYAEFKNVEVGRKQPKFIEIDKNTETFEARARELARVAQQDKAKTDQLRETLEQSVRKAAREKEELQDYIRRHHKATRGINAEDISIPDIDLNRRRSELQNDMSQLTMILALIESNQNDAEHAVSAAQAAAAAAAASSSHHSDSGSSWNSGSSFGGFDSGGSFGGGGGSDSGGSW